MCFFFLSSFFLPFFFFKADKKKKNSETALKTVARIYNVIGNLFEIITYHVSFLKLANLFVAFFNFSPQNVTNNTFFNIVKIYVLMPLKSVLFQW